MTPPATKSNGKVLVRTDSLVGNTWAIHPSSSFVREVNICDLERNLSSFICSEFYSDSYCSINRIELRRSYHDEVANIVEEEEEEEEDSEGGISYKSVGCNQSSRQGVEHLMIEVFVNDRSCANVILAFATLREGRAIAGVDYLLVKGSRKGFEPVLQYLHFTCGCYVSSKSFAFTPAEIAKVFDSAWSKSNLLMTTFKPLELIFDTKEVIPSSDLESIALTIPGKSVKEFFDSAHSCDRNLLRFIEDFFAKEFRISISQFPIIKAANGSVIIGGDRIKILGEDALLVVLKEIQNIVKNRSHLEHMQE